MRNIQIIFGLFVFLSVSSLEACFASDMRQVDGIAQGHYYNHVWKTWSEEPIKIAVIDDGTVEIYAADSLLAVNAFLDSKDVPKFIAGLKKSLEWSAKAGELKLETNKEICRFLMGYLNFSSSNQGQDTEVLLHLRDVNNDYKTIDLYLEQQDVKDLIALFDKIPPTLSELSANEKKAEALK